MEWTVCVCCPASGRQPRWDHFQTWLWAKTLSGRSQNDISSPRARHWGKIKQSTERRQSVSPWARSSRLQTQADQECSHCFYANSNTCRCSFRSQLCYSKHLFFLFFYFFKNFEIKIKISKIYLDWLFDRYHYWPIQLWPHHLCLKHLNQLNLNPKQIRVKLKTTQVLDLNKKVWILVG